MLLHRAPLDVPVSSTLTPPSRILLAEDDAASRRMLTAVLTGEGFEVIPVANGAEAIERVVELRPDVAILDFEMPQVDGAEVCSWLREHEEAAVREIPIIMLTAHTDEADEVACLEAGASDFVVKPASRAALLARIRTQLRLRALSQELHAQNEELARWRAAQEADLHAARITQRSMIPAKPPEVPGWELQSVYEPVSQVGGDVFGWREMADGRWLFWLADATGHGAAAALLTTHAALLFGHAADRTSSPAALLDAVNREFLDAWHGGVYLTALCVAFDVTGAFTIASAGHPPVLVKRANGEVEAVGSRATMIGILPALGCEEVTLTLAPGDLAIGFTDGLFSLRSKDGARMELESVRQAMGEIGKPDLTALIRAVRRRSDGQPCDDDLAAVSWRRVKNV